MYDKLEQYKVDLGTPTNSNTAPDGFQGRDLCFQTGKALFCPANRMNRWTQEENFKFRLLLIKELGVPNLSAAMESDLKLS